MDATNLTIQFPRPEGLIDYYSVEYTLLKPPSIQTDQNQTIASISSSWTTASLSSSGSKNFTDTGGSVTTSGIILVNLGLDDLIAGAGYTIRVRTCSHSMFSDPVHLEAHTSESPLVIIYLLFKLNKLCFIFILLIKLLLFGF